MQAPFDIVHAKIRTEGNVAIFHMAVSGRAGVARPNATGRFEGSSVFSYAWPTTIDPYEAGFERGAGFLALAVTAHPDFEDTPLFDETRAGNLANDGGEWQMHWVVLGPDEGFALAIKLSRLAVRLTQPMTIGKGEDHECRTGPALGDYPLVQQ